MSFRVLLQIGRHSPTEIVLQGPDGLTIGSVPSAEIDIIGGSASSASFDFVVPVRALPDLPLPSAIASLYFQDHLLCRGEVKSRTINPDEGTISVSVGPQRFRTTLTFPPALVGDQIGEARRFPNAPIAVKPDAVPILYGYIKECPLIQIDDARQDADPIVPVRFLIAGHRIASTTIVVLDGDGVPVAEYPVEEALDGLGGVYTYITIMSDDMPDAVFAADVAGYLSNTGGPVHKLGDVLESLWRNYGQGFDLDWTRITKARGPLNRFSVGLRFDQQVTKVSLVDVVESRISGQFPVVFGAPDGRYGWDAALLPADTDTPERHIVYGQNVFASSEITEGELDSIINRAAINYQRSGISDGAAAYQYIDQRNSEACRVSVSKWGESPESQLTFPDVSGLDADDFGQAWAIAEELIRRKGDLFPKITYTTDDLTWLKTPLNTLVSVTDLRQAVRWNNRRALLQSVSLQEGGAVVNIGLLILP